MKENEKEPYDIEAERIILGRLLLPRAEPLVEKITSCISASDFSKSHIELFIAITSCWQRKELSFDNVIDELRNKNMLESSGGVDYLGKLASDSGLMIKEAVYVNRIRKTADARNARRLIIEATARISSGKIDASTSIDGLITELQKIPRASKSAEPNSFQSIAEDHYKLEIPSFAVSLDVDRLRREHNELIGELCVSCNLPGVQTYEGVLSVADFNLSSSRARSERSKLLNDRCNGTKIDWPKHLEELCQRVISSERKGNPAVDLRSLSKPSDDEVLFIDGLKIPKRHPSIIFGDGGSAKSYLALYFTGSLAQSGMNVAIFDWELSGEDHRDRLERIFGPTMPRVVYARCERPLIYEADRLKRIIAEEKIDYAVLDSVAFACSGPPESAEIAGAYFRATRHLGIGTLHIAHVTKAFEGADSKPFGSVFFHNGARATWYISLVDDSRDGDELNIGLFNKKSNLGRLQKAHGYKIKFESSRTWFERSNPCDNPDLAKKTSIKDRLIYLLRSGSMSRADIGGQIEDNPESIDRIIRRHKDTFAILGNGNVGLLR